MNSGSKRIPVSLFAYVVWSAITLLIMRWLDPGEHSLLESVCGGVGWNFVLAILFLVALTRINGWSDLAFVRPESLRSLRILWLPTLYLLVFAGLAAIRGISLTAPQILFVVINTAMVGLSEEFMFRGVLFRALRSRLCMWPAILLTSVLFGGVHVFNVFITGQLVDATAQALAAMMSGFIFMALLLRTGSLWVPIAYHALFDMSIFLATSGAAGAESEPGPSTLVRFLAPMALDVPNLLYALFLLRKVRNEAPTE